MSAAISARRNPTCKPTRGYDSLRVSRKGGRRDALAINPQTAARLRAYLEAAGHGPDFDGPLFRPLKHNGKRQDERRRMDPDAIDRVVRRYVGELGLDRGYSAHSMRVTFITTALENGAQLDVQDRDGAGLVIAAIHNLFPWLRHLFADSVDYFSFIKTRLLISKLQNRKPSWFTVLIGISDVCCPLF